MSSVDPVVGSSLALTSPQDPTVEFKDALLARLLAELEEGDGRRAGSSSDCALERLGSTVCRAPKGGAQGARCWLSRPLLEPRHQTHQHSLDDLARLPGASASGTHATRRGT